MITAIVNARGLPGYSFERTALHRAATYLAQSTGSFNHVASFGKWLEASDRGYEDYPGGAR